MKNLAMHTRMLRLQFLYNIIIFLVQIKNSSLVLLDRHPDIDLTIEKLLNKYGYPVETHEVHTEDGYILSVHRIPHGKNSSKIGTPILFVPGTGGSAENFLILGNNSAIAYYLADRDFDIWLMNQRGTTHSRKHRTLNADTDPEYWQFSWHEVGVYDTPAIIDYIVNVTKEEKIFYIGHSQGTTTYFVLTSERPEYNEKILLGIQFGFSVYIGDVDVPIIKILSRFNKIIEFALSILNIHYIMPQNEELLSALKDFCSLMKGTMKLCASFLNLLDVDEHSDLTFNTSLVPVIVRDSPAGSSVYQLLHYFQLLDSGDFAQYDFGLEGNLKRYNSATPPKYDIRKCTAPVAIFEAKRDFMSTKEGRKKLFAELPNLVYHHVIQYDYFHHADFIWGTNVTRLVNFPVYKLLKRYDKLKKNSQ